MLKKVKLFAWFVKLIVKKNIRSLFANKYEKELEIRNQKILDKMKENNDNSSYYTMDYIYDEMSNSD